ncbi:Uncharacterized protein Fot_06748 [Forsythia ovata]|uniref:Uncharacterized protein n=1 Tax=Forsythia ovata TaxID=205694 RepID=A0ABD1WTZ0_9LAMI
MMEIKQHFDFRDECNKYVLNQLNASWKDEKGDLKREYFTLFVTREDRIENRPDKVLEDQWMVLVVYWEKPKTHGKLQPRRSQKSASNATLEPRPSEFQFMPASGIMPTNSALYKNSEPALDVHGTGMGNALASNVINKV